MESDSVQFVGNPCGKHGPYTFYKALKYTRGSNVETERILTLGEFFLVRIASTAPVSIAELQLLWHNKNASGLMLASVRLYFCPEHTQHGRQVWHGEDELLAEEDKIVLKVADLVTWVVEDTSWPQSPLTPTIATVPPPLTPPTDSTPLPQLKGRNQVLVLSFAQYCRWKALVQRVGGQVDKWVQSEHFALLGGQRVTGDTRVLFCRDTFHHPNLRHHDTRQNQYNPVLKGRPRKKTNSFSKAPSTGDSASKTTDGLTIKNNNQHSISALSTAGRRIKRKLHVDQQDQPGVDALKMLRPADKEQVDSEEELFLHNLHSFMLQHNTPISRLPTLGFKEVDLYQLYKCAIKLGGYEEICRQRLWKQIYDELGGHQSNTSAATSTRKHYERLLLPFEQHEKSQSGDMVTRTVKRAATPESANESTASGQLALKKKKQKLAKLSVGGVQRLPNNKDKQLSAKMGSNKKVAIKIKKTVAEELSLANQNNCLEVSEASAANHSPSTSPTTPLTSAISAQSTVSFSGNSGILVKSLPTTSTDSVLTNGKSHTRRRKQLLKASQELTSPSMSQPAATAPSSVVDLKSVVSASASCSILDSNDQMTPQLITSQLPVASLQSSVTPSVIQLAPSSTTWLPQQAFVRVPGSGPSLCPPQGPLGDQPSLITVTIDSVTSGVITNVTNGGVATNFTIATTNAGHGLDTGVPNGGLTSLPSGAFTPLLFHSMSFNAASGKTTHAQPGCVMLNMPTPGLDNDNLSYATMAMSGVPSVASTDSQFTALVSPQLQPVSVTSGGEKGSTTLLTVNNRPSLFSAGTVTVSNKTMTNGGSVKLANQPIYHSESVGQQETSPSSQSESIYDKYLAHFPYQSLTSNSLAASASQLAMPQILKDHNIQGTTMRLASSAPAYLPPFQPKIDAVSQMRQLQSPANMNTQTPTYRLIKEAHTKQLLPTEEAQIKPQQPTVAHAHSKGALSVPKWPPPFADDLPLNLSKKSQPEASSLGTARSLSVPKPGSVNVGQGHGQPDFSHPSQTNIRATLLSKLSQPARPLSASNGHVPVTPVPQISTPAGTRGIDGRTPTHALQGMPVRAPDKSHVNNNTSNVIVSTFVASNSLANSMLLPSNQQPPLPNIPSIGYRTSAEAASIARVASQSSMDIGRPAKGSLRQLPITTDRLGLNGLTPPPAHSNPVKNSSLTNNNKYSALPASYPISQTGQGYSSTNMKDDKPVLTSPAMQTPAVLSTVSDDVFLRQVHPAFPYFSHVFPSTPLAAQGTTMLPPLSVQGAAMLPSLTAQGAAMLPPLAAQNAALLPPLAAQGTAMLPSLAAQGAAMLPPLADQSAAMTGASPFFYQLPASFLLPFTVGHDFDRLANSEVELRGLH